MSNIPTRIANRLRTGIKRFQPILAAAQSRDVNESDTVVIITDILADVCGYDKYTEITSESAIRGTYCDLAVKVDGTLQFLVEAKAINQELKDNYVKQAIDYAANEGVDWVVLTNSVLWRVYKVTFTKPIDQELVFEFDFSALDAREDEQLAPLYRLTKEGWSKSVLDDYYDQKQALSRFCISAIILSEPILNVIRRELRKLSPDVKIDQDQIRQVLEHEVLKREVVEGEKADEARKRIARSVNRTNRSRGAKEADGAEEPAVAADETATAPQLASTPAAPVSAVPPTAPSASNPG